MLAEVYEPGSSDTELCLLCILPPSHHLESIRFYYADNINAEQQRT